MWRQALTSIYTVRMFSPRRCIGNGSYFCKCTFWVQLLDCCRWPLCFPPSPQPSYHPLSHPSLETKEEALCPVPRHVSAPRLISDINVCQTHLQDRLTWKPSLKGGKIRKDCTTFHLEHLHLLYVFNIFYFAFHFWSYVYVCVCNNLSLVSLLLL